MKQFRRADAGFQAEAITAKCSVKNLKHVRDARGVGCSLDSHARSGAAQEYVAFNKKFLGDVQVTITNNYVGEKALLNSTLSRFIALESGCCAHLTITKKETSEGYQLTVSGNRDAINEMQFHLSSAMR